MATEAVLYALRRTWQILDSSNTKAALAGGLAMAVWKYPRATLDVDILVLGSEASFDEMNSQLLAAGFLPHGDSLLDLGPALLRQYKIEPPDTFVDVQVDLLIANSQYSREAIERRVRVKLDEFGLDLDVLSCEDLILLKLLAGRTIDLVDAEALINANRETLRSEFLHQKAAELKVADQLRQIDVDTK